MLRRMDLEAMVISYTDCTATERRQAASCRDDGKEAGSEGTLAERDSVSFTCDQEGKGLAE